MSGFQGMDVEQVRDHATTCRDGAVRLGDLQQSLEGAIRSVSWTGPDHESLLTHWDRLASSRFSDAVAALREHSDRLARDADEQDGASAADGDGSWRDQMRDAVSDALARRRGLHDTIDRIGEGAEELWEDTTGFLGGLVSDGIGWVEDRVEDGAEWARDRGRDLQDWWSSDPLDLDRPWMEIITDELLDVLEGADTVVRGAGELVGQDWAVIADNAEVVAGQPRVITDSEPPRSLEDLILHNDEARRTMPGSVPPHDYDPLHEAQIRIQTIRGEDGQERYIVHVPPTQGAELPGSAGELWGALQEYDAQGQPFGWSDNLYAMAGRENAGANAVREAMIAAGVPEGSEVMFSSHSQGGLVAAQLTDDPSFNSAPGEGGMYSVTESFSVGSPVETYTPAQPSTHVLNVQHTEAEPWPTDVVPSLDWDGRSTLNPFGHDNPNVQDVTFSTPAPAPGHMPPGSDPGMHVAHDSVQWNTDRTAYDPNSGYYGTVRNNADDPSLAAMADRVDGRYTGDDVELVSDVVVDVSKQN